MSYWVFKVSDRSGYPDVPGLRYVYDNTHSVNVEPNDEFLYLEKAGTRYGLTGAGRISRVTVRRPGPNERHSPKVDRVFTAHLADVIFFPAFFDLSSQTNAGIENRRRTGLPNDLNKIGWSISMPRIDHELFVRLLDSALDASAADSVHADSSGWRVDDSWSVVRRRCRLRAFRAVVLARHDYTCVVCGCRLRSVLDVAHIRSYARDPDQRANPANGLCLCRFCHAAFDACEITVHPDGEVQAVVLTDDPIAAVHFSSVPAAVRRGWLRGVDERFLMERLISAPGSCQEFNSKRLDDSPT